MLFYIPYLFNNPCFISQVIYLCDYTSIYTKNKHIL